MWVLAACSAGYTWLYFNLAGVSSGGGTLGVCLFKRLSGLPCPSCGTTRSIVALIHGDVAGALALNPLGVAMAVILVVAPLWAAFDLVASKHTLWRCHQRAESLLRAPRYALPLILLLLLNWCWTVAKGL